jgi:peptidyl-tRNA hydrolase, PTH1 family
MILIIGLGNPGKKYKNTRHNIGFAVLDRFSEESGFPDFTFFEKGNSLVSQNIPGKEKLLLAKPQTFMNNSGKAAKALIKFYKPEKLIVVHDDIDLPVGKIKLVENRGSAGHKGVASVIRETGTKNFWRLRIGVCPEKGKPENVENFVLGKIKNEEKTVKEAVEILGRKIKEKKP